MTLRILAGDSFKSCPEYMFVISVISYTACGRWTLVHMGPKKVGRGLPHLFFSRYAGYEEEESGCTAFDERPEFD